MTCSCLQVSAQSRFWRNINLKLLKNGFAIFSGVVAVGSKGGLMVPGAVWAVAASMWDVTVSMWAVTSSM